MLDGTALFIFLFVIAGCFVRSDEEVAEGKPNRYVRRVALFVSYPIRAHRRKRRVS